jgi:hypothetical protein
MIAASPAGRRNGPIEHLHNLPGEAASPDRTAGRDEFPRCGLGMFGEPMDLQQGQQLRVRRLEPQGPQAEAFWQPTEQDLESRQGRRAVAGHHVKR